jgi:hypothetical protein
MRRNATRQATQVPAGIVRATPLAGGWHLIEIGRTKGVKRFNLSDAEARQLIEVLGEVLPE